MTKELAWVPVDIDALSPNAAAAYKKYKAANTAKMSAQGELERVLTANARKEGVIKPTESLAFGYRFGRLAVAKIDGDSRVPKASTKPMLKL